MKTFFCHTEADSYFSADCVEIEAVTAKDAAEEFGGSVFEDGADWARPIEVIVAETKEGKNAKRFEVKREQTIADDARELGDAVIHADDEGEAA